MKNDLFTIVPPSFPPSLSAGYEDLETFLELEYQGELPAELKRSLLEKSATTFYSKLLRSIVIATTIFWAA